MTLTIMDTEITSDLVATRAEPLRCMSPMQGDVSYGV
jgi:hypothetical protein